MRTRILAAPILAACVAVAAACGSDSDSGSEAKIPTKADYIKQADEICSAAHDKVEDETKDLDQSSDADFQKYVEAMVTSTQDELTQLRALTPPEGDAEAVNKIYDAVDDAISTIDDQGPEGLPEAGPKLAEAGSLAKDYGFEVCGQDSGSEPATTATATPADAPTKAEYITEADAICTSMQQEFQAAALQLNANPEDVAALGTFQDAATALVRDHVSQLRALTQPVGDEAVLENVYSELDGAADTIESTPTADLLTINDPFENADAAAQEYGFTVCGS